MKKSGLSLWWSKVGLRQALAVAIVFATYFIALYLRGDNKVEAAFITISAYGIAMGILVAFACAISNALDAIMDLAPETIFAASFAAVFACAMAVGCVVAFARATVFAASFATVFACAMAFVANFAFTCAADKVAKEEGISKKAIWLSYAGEFVLVFVLMLIVLH